MCLNGLMERLQTLLLLKLYQFGFTLKGFCDLPKEMDDWTKSLSSVSVAHVKVEANNTKPLLIVCELVRQSCVIFHG
ncbi:hypothetical protein YC2023_051554 [Brassica napus]